jgi:hypothetical protein
MRSRTLAIVLALVGIAFAGYVEYGTLRAADVERSFGLFVFEAGPWVLLFVLSLLSPYGRVLAIIGFVLLALDLYAYYSVFVTGPPEKAVIYLYKPFFGLALVAVAVLAGFLIAQRGEQRR